jgi:hypothetical protein
MATDEEVLNASTHGFVSRDGRGQVRNPGELYRPYRVAEGSAHLQVVFRDHTLSDLIGFHYQRSDGEPAAEDFINKVQEIGGAIASPDPALVPVILDGENCWEHYPGGGVEFLRALYRRCTSARGIQPVRIGEFLQQHPARSTLPRLFAGSWINHNFDIWIGHEEDNTGWDLLHHAREHLRQRQTQGIVAPDKLEKAWREIYIAEGSDWFWWYGPHHSSPQDGLFDYLFRKHVQNVYTLLGDVPPPELSRSISRRAQRAMYTLPNSFLDLQVDGRKRPIDWLGAGRYTVQNERGTMAMVARGPIKDLFFGFTPARLLIRLDCDGPASEVLKPYDQLILGFMEPAGWELIVRHPASREHQIQLRRAAELHDSTGIEVACDQVVMIAIPFDLLGVGTDQPVHFYVELLEGSQSRDRAPRDSTINLARPSIDFERINWDV